MRYDHAAPAVALLTLFGACTEGPTSLAPETDALVPLMDEPPSAHLVHTWRNRPLQKHPEH
jgi:hypothetical protein